MFIIVFRARDDPNIIYREVAELLGNQFPNYETIYNRYIVTLREDNGRGNWKSDMNPILEEIGLADYAIIKSINFIQRSMNNVIQGDPNQTFKNIYFHFGLILNIVEHMARHILRLKNELKLIDLKSTLIKPHETLKEDFQKWLNEKYETSLEKYIEKGKPIFTSVSMPDPMRFVIINQDLLRDYRKFSQNIREFRNIFAHNPSVDIFMAGGILFSPRKDKAKDYPLWTDMINKFENNRDDFINPVDLITMDLNNLLTIINEIWNEFGNNLEVIYTHGNFNNLLSNISDN